MNAMEIIKSVIGIGSTIKDVIDGDHHADGSVDWEKVLASLGDNADLKAEMDALAKAIKNGEYDAAIDAIKSKQVTLRSGRKLSQLSDDEMARYGDLADAKLILATNYLKSALSPTIAQWLVETALPTLLKVLPVVAAVLL